MYVCCFNWTGPSKQRSVSEWLMYVIHLVSAVLSYVFPQGHIPISIEWVVNNFFNKKIIICTNNASKPPARSFYLTYTWRESSVNFSLWIWEYKAYSCLILFCYVFYKTARWDQKQKAHSKHMFSSTSTDPNKWLGMVSNTSVDMKSCF